LRILFDQGVPVPPRKHLLDHDIRTAHELGWHELSNGQLIEAAERAGFGVLMTTDQNLRHQQNLTGRRLAIVVLLSSSWPKVRPNVEAIHSAVAAVQVGDYTEVAIVANRSSRER
jgi:hypothetical protein